MLIRKSPPGAAIACPALSPAGFRRARISLRPPPWKQTCLVLLVLFPVVMLEIRFLSPLLAGQHVAIATFIGNAISVSLVSWPLMKITVFFLKWWLQLVAAHRARVEALGVCTIIGLYLEELLIFMLLY
jgi:antibiotic biosynthesis monooxygenase (ABM) superfamily enzyme